MIFNYLLKTVTRKLFTLKKPEEIQEFIGTIQEKKEDCGKTLKKQVFSHYSNLINSTGHIQQLENDLTTLRKLFTDQQQIFFSLSNSASTPSALSTSNVVSSLSSTRRIFTNLFNNFLNFIHLFFIIFFFFAFFKKNTNWKRRKIPIKFLIF